MRSREDRSSGIAAANKVDDLETVTITEDGVLPFIARDDFEIQFDSHPVGLAAELSNELRKSHAVRKVSRFAVDLEGHEKEFSKRAHGRRRCFAFSHLNQLLLIRY